MVGVYNYTIIYCINFMLKYYLQIKYISEYMTIFFLSIAHLLFNSYHQWHIYGNPPKTKQITN